MYYLGKEFCPILDTADPYKNSISIEGNAPF